MVFVDTPIVVVSVIEYDVSVVAVIQFVVRDVSQKDSEQN